MRLPTLMGVIAAMLPFPVLAQQSSQERRVIMRGVGNDSCGKFLAAVGNLPIGKGPMIRSLDDRTYYSKGEVYAEWIQGYISGFNVLSNNRSQQIDVDYPGVDLWIRKWCDTHAAEPLVEAVHSFIRGRVGLRRQE